MVIDPLTSQPDNIVDRNIIIYIGETDLSAINRIDPKLFGRLAELEIKMRLIARSMPNGWPIGLEEEIFKRLALNRIAFQRIPVITAKKNWPSLEGPIEDGSQLITGRPLSEYGVISLFIDIDDNMLIIDNVLKAAGILGGSSELRSSRVTTVKFLSGEKIEYLKPDLVYLYFERLIEKIKFLNNYENAIIKAIAVYFETTLIHPLRDGNGRLARALFQCVLKTEMNIVTPIFPLGPASNLDTADLLNAKFSWYFEANANPLVEFIVGALEEICAYYLEE